jgi:hypothetical protein
MFGIGSIDVVQKKLGVPGSQHWDPVTLGAMTAYQASKAGVYPMSPHGHPDPPTLVNLGYYDPIAELPEAQRDYVEGGDKPTTFFRDLGSAANQVPQWAWVALGVSFVAIGVWTYRKAKKG